jgi:NTE family protein
MKVQLCLSCGGARGFAHLGVIQALSEMGFEFERISATSAGAMAGSFIAAGFAPQDVLELFIKNQLFKMFSSAFNRGLLKMDGFEKLLQTHLPEDFNDLKIPFIVGATDLLKGNTVFFSEGKIAPVIMGASSIPGLFKPVSYLDYLLVDGGVLNNLPVEPLKKYQGPIVGVHVNPVGVIPAPTSTFAILERSFHLSVFSNTVYREKECALFIEPSGLKYTKVFDYKKAKEIYKAGYEEVVSRADEILEMKF